MTDRQRAPSHPLSKQMRDRSGRGDPRRMRCADGGKLDLPRNTGSATCLCVLCVAVSLLQEGREGCARTRRRGRQARGCAAGRTPTSAAHPRPHYYDDTRLGTSPADWGMNRTPFIR